MNKTRVVLLSVFTTSFIEYLGDTFKYICAHAKMPVLLHVVLTFLKTKHCAKGGGQHCTLNGLYIFLKMIRN